MPHRSWLITVLLTLVWSCGTNSKAATISDPIAELAVTPQWFHLLHYQHRWLRGIRSLATNSEFFIHPQGRENPELELRAFVAAVQDNQRRVPPLGIHPQCAFPARYAFVKQALHLNTIDQKCDDFREWQSRLNASSVRLVFAAAYTNNPASIFGHTFLVFGSDRHRTGPQGSQLLDYAVGFLANTSQDDNAAMYVLKGVSGGYDGFFIMDPYYMTVGIYNNGESRDLWEYPLDLSPTEVNTLVAHLWEVQMQGRFGYYFLDENCSYMLLSLLDAVRPTNPLTQNAGFFVLPLETVRRAVSDQPTITPVQRPSLKRQWDAVFSALSNRERQDFYSILDREDLGNLADISTATLDAYIAYQDYINFQKKRKVEPSVQKKYRDALTLRSHRPEDPIVPTFETPAPPHVGHGPHQVHLFAGRSRDENEVGLGLQYGLHDLLADDRGYDSFAAIQYFSLEVVKRQTATAPEIASYTIAEVTSLRPFDRLTREFSWHLGFGGQRMKDADCDHCLVHYGEAAGGLAWNFNSRNWLGYTLAQARIDGSNQRKEQLRAEPSLRVGVLGSWSQQKVQIESQKSFDTGNQSYRGDDGQLHTRQSWNRYEAQYAYFWNSQNETRLKFLTIPRSDIHLPDYREWNVSWYRSF